MAADLVAGAVPRRRNSPVLLVVRAAGAATTLVPALLAWAAARTRWPEIVGVPLDVVVVIAAVAAVLGSVTSWWTTCFAVDVDGVVLERGVVVRRSTSVAWSEVVAVQVSRPAVSRALRCARVCIGIGAESTPDIVLEAVPDAVATRIEEAYAAGRDRRLHRALAPATAVAPTPVRRSEVLYRIHDRDYLVLSVTYGQFVLVVPFLLGAYENLAAIGWWPSVRLAVPDGPGPIAGAAALALVAAVVVAVVFGVTVAWLRYRHFEVRVAGDAFTTTGGLRSVPRARAAGIRIQQNPVMRVLGYGRVAVVSRQAGTRLGSNTVFPCLPLDELRSGVATHFPGYAALAARSIGPTGGLAAALLGLAACVLAVGGAVAA